MPREIRLPIEAAPVAAPELPFADRDAGLRGLRDSILADAFGAGGSPRAAPPPRLSSLRALWPAARAAARGAYGADPGRRPGALEAAAATLAWLGPLRGPALRALAAGGPGLPPSLSAALDDDAPIGPIWLTAPEPDWAAPIVVAAPDVWTPLAITGPIAAFVAPAGAWAPPDAGASTPGGAAVLRYDVGPGAAHENDDVDFAQADDLSRRLFAGLGVDDPYLEAARRAVKLAAARRLALGRGVLEAVARAPDARRMVLLAGLDDWRPLAHDLLGAGCGGAGFAVIHAGRGVESRLAFTRHAWRLGAARPAGWVSPAVPYPDAADLDAADRDRARRAADIAAAARAAAAAIPAAQLPAGAAALVVGDLRAPDEPRWAPTLRALLARLLREGEVCLLEPWSARSSVAAIGRRLRRLGLGGVTATPFLRCDAPDPALAAACRPALAAAGDALGAALGTGGLLLEASRKLASDWPVARAHGRRIEAWLAQGPRRCFLLPGGGRLEAWTAAVACARAGAPAIEAQAVLTSESPRYDAPLASDVACIDAAQRDLLRRRFGLDETRLHVVGLHEIDLQRIARSARPAAADAHVVFYPTQGLPRLDAAALQLLAAADLGAMGLRLKVSAHPSMDARQRAALEGVLGAAVPWTDAEGLDQALADDVLAVATLFSNVAYRAALLGRPVLMLRFVGVSYPVRFDTLGLAQGVSDPAGLRRALAELLRADRLVDRGVPPFLVENPHFLEGSAIDRLAAIHPARTDAG